MCTVKLLQYYWIHSALMPTILGHAWSGVWELRIKVSTEEASTAVKVGPGGHERPHLLQEGNSI